MEGRFVSLRRRLGIVSWRSTFVYILAVASVSLNVSLAHKLKGLSDTQRVRMSERLLKIGATAPTIAAKSLDGRRDEISYRGDTKPTVLYVFTPACSWCARNMDNFKQLVDKDSGQYRFVGLSLSEVGLGEYVAKNDLKIPVYRGFSQETLKAYKLGSTPQTIVISPEGKVLQDWLGAYIGDQKSQIEAFFQVSLPGLQELPKEAAAKN